MCRRRHTCGLGRKATADERYPHAMAPDSLLTPWGWFRRSRWWWQVLAWLTVPPLPVSLWAASQPRHGRGLAWGLVVLVTAAWLSVGWATGASESSTGAEPVGAGSSSTTSTMSTTAPPITTSTTGSPTTPGAARHHGAPGGDRSGDRRPACRRTRGQQCWLRPRPFRPLDRRRRRRLRFAVRSARGRTPQRPAGSPGGWMAVDLRRLLDARCE